MLTGFEADLIQGRHGISLGFANPALYDFANTPTFNDVTGDPQGQGVPEADVLGPASGGAVTMGQCATPSTWPAVRATTRSAASARRDRRSSTRSARIRGNAVGVAFCSA